MDSGHRIIRFSIDHPYTPTPLSLCVPLAPLLSSWNRVRWPQHESFLHQCITCCPGGVTFLDVCTYVASTGEPYASVSVSHRKGDGQTEVIGVYELGMNEAISHCRPTPLEPSAGEGGEQL